MILYTVKQCLNNINNNGLLEHLNNVKVCYVQYNKLTLRVNLNVWMLNLDGKNVFQCFWSDPKTRVFECFWASLCILDGKNVFECFWLDPKTRVFYCFSEVLYCFCHLGLPFIGGVVLAVPLPR